MTDGLEALFDDALYSAVASAQEVDPDRLRRLAADLQTAARSVRSVDDLVFEYRKAFGDVIVQRTPEAYFLLLPPHVWPEFAARLDASDDELEALRALHRQRLQQEVERDGLASDVDSGDPLVLSRE